MSSKAGKAPESLSSRLVEKLRGVRTPVIYDALERYGIRSQVEGYTDHSVRCLLPSLGAFVGFACTGRVTCSAPAVEGETVVSWQDVWSYVRAMATPSIAVVEDVDVPVGRGCVWGDVSAAIFRANGCAAVVTNGSVRDLRAVEEIGFGLFAGSAVVGHGYGRYVEIGGEVTVGGMTVASGTLIHADEHGALTIPAEVKLDELLQMVETVAKAEQQVIDYCGRSDFDIAELDRMHTWSMHTAG